MATNDEIKQAVEDLTYYRNLYYTDPSHTEHGKIANALNVILPLFAQKMADTLNTPADTIFDIAKKHILPLRFRNDLEPTRNDSLDFIEVSVWSLKNALTDAYILGSNDQKNRR